MNKVHAKTKAIKDAVDVGERKMIPVTKLTYAQLKEIEQEETVLEADLLVAARKLGINAIRVDREWRYLGLHVYLVLAEHEPFVRLPGGRADYRPVLQKAIAKLGKRRA